jgi:pimeloyl-ACP methyl ester carboxylesterase
MKSTKCLVIAGLPLAFLILSLSLSNHSLAVDEKEKFHNNQTPFMGLIHEEKFILINSIEMWVTIKGESSMPVVLFLHGGPGSPISPYSGNLYKEFEKDFIIVQWDQRGAGKTYGRNAPEELTPDFLKANPLTLDQMVSDGILLTEYLLKHLGKQKVILFGTSWGSLLGVTMATKRPDLFYAYVGHSQIVNPANDTGLYNKVYKMATESKDTASIAHLNTLGKPPYEKARNVGRLFRVVKKYESLNAEPPPDAWFTEATEYFNDKDNQSRSDGDDYSFVNYVGDSGLGVQSMRSGINLVKDNLEFKVPVFFIQGSEDLLTPAFETKLYFDKIIAPQKEYFLLPNTAHGFNLPVLETQLKIFKAIKAT